VLLRLLRAAQAALARHQPSRLAGQESQPGHTPRRLACPTAQRAPHPHRRAAPARLQVLPSLSAPPAVQQQLAHHIRESDAKSLKEYLRALVTQAGGAAK
jgi:hypothetical protein